MTKSAPPVEELTYEQAFAELEALVAALETEEQNLDETITQFERGQALAQHCAVLLDKAEIKVQQISGDEITDFEN